MAKFSHSLNNFDPIDVQPSDTDLTRLREAVAPLLLQIPYDETGAGHNPIGLIRQEAAYVDRYGGALTKPTRIGTYDATIDDAATAIVRARSEAAHKAKRADRATYKTARWETIQFVLAVIADNWVHKLRDSDLIYTKVAPKDILSNLQAGSTGRHALDILALHNEMQR